MLIGEANVLGGGNKKLEIILQKMERIELYKFETPYIKISIELYFNEKGQLIFDGYDIGKKVEECWGDSDYEYYYTIEPLHVERLFSILDVVNGNRHSLLLELKKNLETILHILILVFL